MVDGRRLSCFSVSETRFRVRAITRLSVCLSFCVVAGIGIYVFTAVVEEAGATAVEKEELFPRDFHATPVQIKGGPNVLLITIDTLRADHMSLYGYDRPTTPHIDAFAQESRVFDRAYATAPFTPASVVSFLTGKYPYHHRVRMFWQKVTAENITVADHLRRAGYQTAAVVSNIVLSDDACGLGVRFDDYDDNVNVPEPNRPHMRERRAVDTTDDAIAWLRTRRKAGRPFFLWVHYNDPHGPYTPPADAPADFTHETPVTIEEDRLLDYVKEPGLLDGLEYVDRYDEEIAYTDREVGRLLDAFDSVTAADDALVLLTADHGEQMMDGDRFFFCHGYGVRHAVLHVPLLVRYKSIPAERNSTSVSVADVTPTILDVVGLPIPEDMDGRSLVGAISSCPPYAEGPDAAIKGRLMRAYIMNDRKVVIQHGRSNIPRKSWAYDLRHDPTECEPLAVDPAEPGYVTLCQITKADPDPAGQPESFARGVQPSSAPIHEHADAEALKSLKSLGYVE